MKNTRTYLFTLLLTIALIVIAVPMTTVAAANKPLAPKSPTITWNRKYPAGSGLAVYLKWKKVKNADGYQIYIKGKIGGSDGMSYSVKKYYRVQIKGSRTYKRLTEGGTCKWIQAKVRAYRIVKGKKVYGKWSKLVKRNINS